MANVALVTCAELPELDDGEDLVIDPLRADGIDADIVVWDDESIDWSAYDLAIIRTVWDYPTKRDDFVEWARSVPRLANPAHVVEWNTDKRYLQQLSDLEVPVVPTIWLEPGDEIALPTAGTIVIKPAISAGSLNTGKYNFDEDGEADLAFGHVLRLRDTGSTVMVQPYLAAIDTAGETSLLYFNGSFSHSIRKGPMLTGQGASGAGLYLDEKIEPRIPTAAEHATAQHVLDALPDMSELLYARVDLVPGPDGLPMLIELELTEPSLFLPHSSGAARRFARAIAARIG